MRVAIRVTCALLKGVGGKGITIKKKQEEKETHNKRLKYDSWCLKMAAFEEAFYPLNWASVFL